MRDMARISVETYMHLADLVLAVEKGADTHPGSVGVWYAEKLERAAEKIRNANAYHDHEGELN